MHPYSNLPAQHFWRTFVSETPWRELPLGGEAKFQLQGDTKIATAGSCFAQHIARYLAQAGRSTYIAEQPHPLSAEFGGETDSYKLFSARYGNVYTARQCLELLQQAMDWRPMIEDFTEQDGRIFDLLRPNAVPNGFTSHAEARADRVFHLACVRKMFREADVFVFTLGLTESWYHAEEGHTYPVCPGTARGTFGPGVHKFHNLTHAEVVAELEVLLEGFKRVNPELKVIFTVSPVPLVATHTQHNVLVASSYSKSVLRAACGEVEQRHGHVQYFPSFEIVGHTASFGQYLASDLREVTERGVSHVMASFFSTFYSEKPRSENGATRGTSADEGLAAPAEHTRTGVAEVECEEMFNQLIR